MKVGFKYGLMYGVSVLLIALIVSLVSPDLFMGRSLSAVINIAIPLIFIALACKAYKNKHDGVLNIGEGMVAGWSTYAIGSLIGSLSILMVMSNFAPDTMEALRVDVSDSFQEGFASGYNGASGNTAAEAELNYELNQKEHDEIATTMVDWMNPYHFKGTIIFWFLSIMTVGLLYSWLVSLIVKRV